MMKTYKRKFELSDERAVNEIARMINCIVAKKRDTLPKNLDREDITQELWTNVLSVMQARAQASGDIDTYNPLQDMNLYAQVCYCRIIDMIRYSVNRPYIQADLSSFDRKIEKSNCESSNSYELLWGPRYESPDEYAIINDIIEMFPEGSKERKLIDMIASVNKVRENPDYIGPETCAVDRYYSEQLGYASSSSSGYTRLRTKVRNAVKDYYDGKVITITIK